MKSSNNLIRIQKVISDSGFSSRRKAEEFIQQGRVKVNGRPAAIGMKIDPRKHKITIDGQPVNVDFKKRKYYIAVNKPRGYVTTMSDELGRKDVTQLVKDIPERLYPVGRLDMNSEGLLLMTNDGEFANLLMHPKNEIEKIYRVTIKQGITDTQLVSLTEGIMLEGRRTLPAIVRVISQEPGRTVIQMTIKEGRNRQIRKMFEALGFEVKRLKRIQIGSVRLGMLKPGTHRPLNKLEIDALLNQAKTKEENNKYRR